MFSLILTVKSEPGGEKNNPFFQMIGEQVAFLVVGDGLKTVHIFISQSWLHLDHPPWSQTYEMQIKLPVGISN